MLVKEIITGKRFLIPRRVLIDEDIEFDNWDEERVIKSDKEKLQYVLYILKDII